MAARQLHSDEFKIEVVRDMLARNLSIREMASERGINKSMLGKWRTQFTAQAKREEKKAKMEGSPTLLPASSDARPRGRSRSRHDAEIKAQMVARMLSGESPAALSRETGIGNPVLYAWRKAARKAGAVESAPQSNGNGATAAQGRARAAPLISDLNVRDAITYLKNAEREINRKLIGGAIKELSQEHLLTLLALKTLQGAM